MGNNAIQNSYDGPEKPIRKLEGCQFSLDFAYSQDAAEVDEGIRETIRGVKISIMAMGIALYRVDVSGLFIDLGFKKFGEYIDHLAEDTGMARTSLYNWEYIGEAYVKHRADLDRIGFSDDDGPTKLPFLSRALEHYTKRDVFKNIKNMTKREFEDWSRGTPPKKKKYKNIRIKGINTAGQSPAPAACGGFPQQSCGVLNPSFPHSLDHARASTVAVSLRSSIKGSHVFVGNSPLVSFTEGISPSNLRYYEALLLEGAKAIEKNEYAKIYRFYDETEARQFDRFYQKELKNIRAKK